MVHDLGDPPRPVLAALAAAERVLSRRAGAGIVLADPEDLGGSDRSVVARARVVRNPFSLPRTLVVKHYVADPAPDRPDPFHYEVASCQLFTALPADDRSSPVLIAHDPDARLLVLEDLGRSSTLADKLFGPDAGAAQRCLLGWARALGRMQAATAGREGDFGALLRRQGERAWRDPMAEEARAALAGVPGLLDTRLGVPVGAAAVQQAHETVRLLGGTRYRAFSPSDTCPDNNLVTSRGVRFVDFEWGCFRDIVLDAAYFRVPFPACEASFALPPVWRRRSWRRGGPRSPACGRSSTSPNGCSAASSMARCCGCGCAPGGCCRGCPTRRPWAGTPRLGRTLPVAADQHRACALLAGTGNGGGRRRRPEYGRTRRRGGRGAAPEVPGRAGAAGRLPAPSARWTSD